MPAQIIDGKKIAEEFQRKYKNSCSGTHISIPYRSDFEMRRNQIEARNAKCSPADSVVPAE